MRTELEQERIDFLYCAFGIEPELDGNSYWINCVGPYADSLRFWRPVGGPWAIFLYDAEGRLADRDTCHSLRGAVRYAKDMLDESLP